MTNSIFNKEIPNPAKLLKYGFRKNGDTYTYVKPILDGQFLVKVTVANGQVGGQVFDSETDDEYVLAYSDEQYGKFIGQVRDAYQAVLTDIADNCCDSSYFSSAQANRITKLIEEKFGERPDFPFKKFPDYGVFRNQGNNKWYGLIMNIDKQRLTKKAEDASQRIEIIDFKIDPTSHEQLLKEDGFYPGYHMNRDNWITVILDGSVADGELLDLLKKSRSFTQTGTRKPGEVINWLVPGNPKYYDIPGHFKVGKETIWKQSSKVNVGDIVYLYVTAPVKAVKYQCQVTGVNIPYDAKNDLNVKKVMQVKVLREYDDQAWSLAKLKNYGIKVVRGPRKIGADVSKELDK